MTALYILGAVLLLLLAGVVLAPLVEREPPDRDVDELPPRERREAAVEALSELEFEYRTDKLSEEDYRRLRAHYGRIALEAEEELEQGAGAAAGDDGASRPGPDGKGASAGTASPCPACGADVPAGASFCPGCGASRTGRPAES